MKTACLIGNSHLGALKAGWDARDASARPIDVAFFGAKAQSLRRTFVQRGRLRSNDRQVRRSLERTGGAPEIDLSRYDMFLLVGVGLHFRFLARLALFACVHPHDSPGYRLASRALLTEGFLPTVRGAAGWELARNLSAATDAPIYVMPEPFFGKGALASGEHPLVNHVHDVGMGEAFGDVFDKACEKAFAPYGRFVAQPRATRADFIFTADAYSLDAIGLKRMIDTDKEAREDDYVHKNAAYGEEMLRAFFETAAL